MKPAKLALAGAVAAALLLPAGPAESQAPRQASIVAADNVFTSQNGGAPNVTIPVGGHVDFSYPFGHSRHNVVFTGLLPLVCGGSGGPPATDSALPGEPTGPGWDGGCDFQTPGTYPFVCALHSSMTGSVTVVEAGSLPAPPPPPSPPLPSSQLVPAGPVASGLKVALRQRGTSVRGTVRVARAGSRLLARATVPRRALYGGRSRLAVQVGRQLRAKVSATTATFATALSPIARRTLRAKGRLLISLRVTVTPPTGKPYTATRTVILRPPL